MIYFFNKNLRFNFVVAATNLQNECGHYNVSSLEQCAAIVGNDGSHTEWRTSMGDNGQTVTSSDGVTTATLVNKFTSNI